VHRHATIKYAPCGSISAYQCRHNDALAAATDAPFSVKTFKPTKADTKHTHAHTPLSGTHTST